MKTTAHPFRYWLVLAAACGLAGAALAQPGPPPGAGPDDDGPDRFRRHFFEPELIMRHAREIALTEEQRGQVRTIALATQAKHSELQWALGEAKLALGAMAEADNVDTAAALAQFDKVLAAETALKRNQMEAALKIRALLTPAQRQQLLALRPARRDDGKGARNRDDRGPGGRNDRGPKGPDGMRGDGPGGGPGSGPGGRR